MKPLTFRLHLLVFAMLFWASTAAWASSDRQAVFVSDLHVGAGRTPQGKWRNIEDFRWQPEFDKFLDFVDAQGKGKTDLVLVGDVFELWQSPSMTCSGDLANPGCTVPDCHDDDTEIGCSEKEAVARLEYTLKQHPDFVESIRKFGSAGDNRVYFIPGNHDAALLFNEVRRTLLDRFAGTRVEVLTAGYWLSADGAIYADHGHQFDDVNKFGKWPSPFVDRDGVSYLRKPWGENMVQQFYNQYEEVFPIVDNLSDEKAGLQYAVEQAGLSSSAAAVGKFFRFFLFQQSLRQGAIALGTNGTAVKWNYAAVREKPVAFFLPLLKDAPALSAKASEALSKEVLFLERNALTEIEIDALCGAKQVSAKGPKCPTMGGGTLGAGVKALLVSDRKLLARYLEEVLPRIQRPGERAASLYVYGHTHRAVPATAVTLARMPGGVKQVSFVNTGAFQRVASAEQIDAILRNANGQAKRSVLDLQPEDLPACYTFVAVPPYESKPGATVMTWSRNTAGEAIASAGTCLDAR
ncbi:MULTISPECIES: metallophosphoesterase [unclassified Variovorax]|uniref:metallophosphoesterase n=1 Tax=unclassified Variovorax TaxID=663243 RepID=UPI003F4899BB